jgi:hypothetical protein
MIVQRGEVFEACKNKDQGQDGSQSSSDDTGGVSAMNVANSKEVHEQEEGVLVIGRGIILASWERTC